MSRYGSFAKISDPVELSVSAFAFHAFGYRGEVEQPNYKLGNRRTRQEISCQISNNL